MAFQALKTLSAYSCTCGLYNTVTKNYTLHDKIYMPIPRDYILAKIVKTFKTCSRHGWQLQVCENSFKTIKSIFTHTSQTYHYCLDLVYISCVLCPAVYLL